jgi:hypothetical protein
MLSAAEVAVSAAEKRSSAFVAQLQNLIDQLGSNAAGDASESVQVKDMIKIYSELLTMKREKDRAQRLTRPTAFSAESTNSIFDDSVGEDNVEEELHPRERFMSADYRRRREETLSKVDHELVERQSRRLAATYGVNRTGTFKSYYSKNYIGMAPVYW